jgi:hypothetical protein
MSKAITEKDEGFPDGSCLIDHEIAEPIIEKGCRANPNL